MFNQASCKPVNGLHWRLQWRKEDSGKHLKTRSIVRFGNQTAFEIWDCAYLIKGALGTFSRLLAAVLLFGDLHIMSFTFLGRKPDLYFPSFCFSSGTSCHLGSAKQTHLFGSENIRKPALHSLVFRTRWLQKSLILKDSNGRLSAQHRWGELQCLCCSRAWGLCWGSPTVGGHHSLCWLDKPSSHFSLVFLESVSATGYPVKCSFYT